MTTSVFLSFFNYCCYSDIDRSPLILFNIINVYNVNNYTGITFRYNQGSELTADNRPRADEMSRKDQLMRHFDLLEPRPYILTISAIWGEKCSQCLFTRYISPLLEKAHFGGPSVVYLVGGFATILLYKVAEQLHTGYTGPWARH